jgi:DNA (cytosine-5)-methyltransferase 1
MKHGSLFSGIGGFDLAAEWMGWENVFHCGWNPFGQKVLKHYWPKAISYHDITKTDFTIHRGAIDIITGGFPFQPYSSAGKRLGKDDERHLWPEMLRCIREVSPRWIVGENVRGLTNWNGGMVFDEVQADLETIGYEVLPFLLPACAVNAPHRRDRIWFVAHAISASERANELRGLRCQNGEIGGERTQTIYDAFGSNGSEGITTNSNSNGLNECNSNNEVNTNQGSVDALGNFNKSNGDGDATDSLQIRLQQCENGTEMGGGQKEICGQRSESSDGIEANGKIRNAANSESESGRRELQQQQKQRESGGCNSRTHSNNWENFPTVSPVCNGDDGLSNRLDSITFPKWRNESIKAGGNAVVPQVVYQIFKAIDTFETQNLKK